MDAQRVLAPINVSVIVKKAGENIFVAHALEYDVVCQSHSPEAAVNKLIVAMKAYVEFAILSDQYENMAFAAPAEYWAGFDDIETFQKVRSVPVAKNPISLFWAMNETPNLACAVS